MNETLTLVRVWLAGAALGAMFFGGLWWTVRRGVASGRPALWFAGSMLLRTSITLAGFFLAARGDWKRLVACLTGFVVARLAVSFITRKPMVSHAP